MERNKMLVCLKENVEILKKEHVVDLMREKRVEELEKIAQQLDLTTLKEHFDEEVNLNLEFEEFPKDSLLEVIFICNQSSIADFEFFDDWCDIQEKLKEQGGELEVTIAELMDIYCLCDLTLEVLLTGKDDDFDEECEDDENCECDCEDDEDRKDDETCKCEEHEGCKCGGSGCCKCENKK